MTDESSQDPGAKALMDKVQALCVALHRTMSLAYANYDKLSQIEEATFGARHGPIDRHGVGLDASTPASIVGFLGAALDFGAEMVGRIETVQLDTRESLELLGCMVEGRLGARPHDIPVRER